MATTVESVDNLPKPPPQDRVNPTERSSTDQQRRQFKKALKEEMEQNEGERKDACAGNVVERQVQFVHADFHVLGQFSFFRQSPQLVFKTHQSSLNLP